MMSAVQSRSCGSGSTLTRVMVLAGVSASVRGSHRSEEHTSELQSLMRNSYGVVCLKKKKIHQHHTRKQSAIKLTMTNHNLFTQYKSIIQIHQRHKSHCTPM